MVFRAIHHLLIFVAVAIISASCQLSALFGIETPEEKARKEMKSGLYMGITGFNDNLTSFPIQELNYATKPLFDNFIDGLVMKNGTLLYYSVSDAIDKLQTAKCPYDLCNASLVSFTDGLDQGTPGKVDNYPGNAAYLKKINNRILNENVSGVPMTSWAIGLRGKDVNDEEQFKSDLRSIASSKRHVISVSNMSTVNDAFQQIAKNLNETRDVQRIALTIPMVDNGVQIRFTLDGAKTAESSYKYIEGVFDLRNHKLKNVKYVGIETSSANTVEGRVDDIFVTFLFSEISNKDGVLINQDEVSEWLYRDNNWGRNSEFVPAEQASVIKEQRSAIVLLNLDCSTSLGEDFPELKLHAKAFLETLCDAAVEQK
jgi:hypothetical protein